MGVLLDFAGWILCWILRDVGCVGYNGMWIVLDIADWRLYTQYTQ